MQEFESVIPVLNVKNLASSIDYYVNKLGFKLNWDWGDPPDFCSISRGHAEIFLCQGEQGQPGTWLCFNMKDVDALFEEYKKSGAIIKHEPETYPWNMREMLVQDLDGHCFRMGHNTEESTEAECPT